METIHVWEKKEITLYSSIVFDNPYIDVDVWVQLKGPDFDKRIYGFWDGDNVFKIRITTTCPGEWSYISGSNTIDEGLNGKYGSFKAVEWSEAELKENKLRHGFIIPSKNSHAFMHADGTPFYLLADTWWSTPTDRLKWYDDDIQRETGPDMGFKDMVRFRKKQNYNCIAMIVGHPTWNTDKYPSTLIMDDEYKTCIRQAWEITGISSSDTRKSWDDDRIDSDNKSHKNAAKTMKNEGGRPFLFPGRIEGYEDVVPDFERINPDYFKYMDRKIDYLNDNGFVCFIEATRRDVGQVWKRYGGWPATYSKYLQYIFARYHANNCLLSPIHMDYVGYTIPSREYNEPINLYIDKYGQPPFGTPVGTNASPSTLANFGGSDDCRWLTFHQTGNWREHDNYYYLTELFNAKPVLPALNGEPYYPGFPDNNPIADSKEAEKNVRSSMYGSFLSGGLAGFMYGCEGVWGSNTEEGSLYYLWDALQFESGRQVHYLNNFIYLKGAGYQELIPNCEMVTPNKSGAVKGYTGWAYCACTKEKDWFMLYFEEESPNAIVRSVIHDAKYRVQWFNPRNGEWLDDVNFKFLISDQACRITLPDKPTNEDWGLSLTLMK